MLCTHQTSCTKMEHGISHLHANPCSVLSNTVDFLNPSSDPVISSSGSPASYHLSHFTGYHDDCASHSQQHHRQLQPLVTSNHLIPVGSPNFENPYMPSSSMNNYLSNMEIGSHQQASSNTRGASRSHHGTGDSRGAHKDKNAVQVPVDYVHDLSPQNLGLQSCDELCEVRFNMMSAANFNAPDYRHGFLPLAEGSQPDVTHLQMESPFLHHHNHNHLFQVNYFGPSFQPGFTRAEPLTSNPGVGSMWNNPTIPYYFEGSQDFGNMGCRQGFTFSRNPVIFHSPSIQSLHLQPVQGMQVPNYSHHPRSPALNYLLHHHMINTSREGLDAMASGPRPFPSNVDEWSYRPYRHLPQAVVPSGNRLRILSAQGNAVLEFPSFHGADNFFDQHRHMRLDIDNMSYEELLALEEQIGDVETGLPEETILKNLKMNTCCVSTSLVNSLSDKAAEPGTCIICQVVFTENERVGTLRCGHEFHVGCIKQWLLLKNLCPICKTSVLDTDGKER